MKVDMLDSMTYALKQTADNAKKIAGRNNKMRKWKCIKNRRQKFYGWGYLYIEQ